MPIKFLSNKKTILTLACLVVFLLIIPKITKAEDCIEKGQSKYSKCQFTTCCNSCTCVEKRVQTGYVSVCQSPCAGETAEPKKIVPIKFIPNITIPGSITIGGKKYEFIAGKEVIIDNMTIGLWISVFYQFFCWSAGILAAVMIMYGGYKYIVSFGNASRMSDAKNTIYSALFGLVLALGAYVILYTINPNLVKFESLDIKPIPTILLQYQPGMEESEDYGQGQQCFLDTYGASQEAVESKLKDLDFQGRTVKVHELALAAFQKVNQAITAANLSYSFNTVNTFSWREAVGAGGKRSLHSWGIAMDINGSRNPYCPYQWDQYPNLTSDQQKICKNGGLVTDLPDALVQAFKENGFIWGGGWTSSKDAMHFEWHGYCY